MTVNELSKLYHLNREIELNKKQHEDLKAEIEECEEELKMARCSMDGMHSTRLDGMPHSHSVSSPVENAVSHIMRLEEELYHKREALIDYQILICKKQTAAIKERDRLERYIDTIDDPLMRQIFTLRFVNGLSWEDVAAGLGEGYIDESVRVSCYRYVKKSNKGTHKGATR